MKILIITETYFIAALMVFLLKRSRVVCSLTSRPIQPPKIGAFLGFLKAHRFNQPPRVIGLIPQMQPLVVRKTGLAPHQPKARRV